MYIIDEGRSPEYPKFSSEILKIPVLSEQQDKDWLVQFGLVSTVETLESLQYCINQDTEDLRVDQSNFQQ